LPVRYRVEITRTAEADLEEIWTLIAADSLESAAQFVVQLEDRIATLERMPTRCPLIRENAQLGAEYRHLIIGDYRVVFRVEGRTVYILRLIHGNRLLDASHFGEHR
jgi:toxin ParE1/3/4